MTVLKFCVIFVFFGFSLQAKIINSQSLICNPNDLDALVSFWKNLELGVEGWSINSSSRDCCSWEGITCNSSSSLGLNDPNVTGRVVQLDLGRKKIAGNLSESLGNLDQLRTLNLSHNFIKGPIPGSLFHLPVLEVLDLSYNHISAWFPGDINLPSIRVLDVSENSIIGPVPVGICSNSTKISVMNLEANYFSRSLPMGLGNCTSLQDFTLAANYLSGRLPEDLFRLSNLRNLALQENRFSGQLSGLIGNLSNLVHLDLSFNEFSGNIPDVFHNFLNMKSFSAESNYFNGTLPNSLTSSGTLASLSLRNNSLVGTIDLNCTTMVNLVSLDLATNQFHGKIPDNLPACPRLKAINFAKINFKGQVPESFMNFQSLSYLSLSNSSVVNLAAALEILQHCKNLTTLVLTLNFHGESMPSYPSLQFSGLRVLVIASCGLTGIIPQWLKGSTKLQLLDLSWNLLEDPYLRWYYTGGTFTRFYIFREKEHKSRRVPL